MKRVNAVGCFLVSVIGCGSPPERIASIAAIEKAAASGIIQGHPARDLSYPATGAILGTTEEDGVVTVSFLCTGVLIASDVVMAAGHCNAKLLGDLLYPVHLSFSVASDVSDLKGAKGPTLEAVGVRRVVAHPEYRVEQLGPGLREAHDLSLLVLSRVISDVQPVEMVSEREGLRLGFGQDVVIVGYGITEFEKGRARSMHAVGQKNWGTTRLGKIGVTEMQVGFDPGFPQKCYGDSGGPTFLNVGHDPVKREVLIGITSRTFDEMNCGAGGIDTRVDKYRDWIDSMLDQTCRMGIRPSCIHTIERQLTNEIQPLVQGV